MGGVVVQQRQARADPAIMPDRQGAGVYERAPVPGGRRVSAGGFHHPPGVMDTPEKLRGEAIRIQPGQGQLPAAPVRCM